MFFENCILSRESYAFPRVTAENCMGYVGYDIAKEGKSVFADFIEIFQSKMKRVHVNKGL